MTVGFDATNDGNSVTSPLTFAHTCGASATELILAVNVDQPVGSAPTCSATYNSVSMTAVSPASGNVGTSGYLFIFHMTNPPTGVAHNVVVTASGGSGFGDITAGTISFTGSTTVGTAVYSNGSGTTSSVVMATNTSGNLIAGFAAAGDTINSTTSPSTERFRNNNSGPNGFQTGNLAGATSPSTGSSVTMAWSDNTSPWVTGAIEVQVAAAAAFVAAPAMVVGQGSTPTEMTGIVRPPTVRQAVRRGGYY